jgi:hypothetical protein
LPVDLDTEHVVSRSERITWLICMLFIAVKAIARGGSNDLLRFVSESYRDICATYELDGATIDVLDSFSRPRHAATPRSLRRPTAASSYGSKILDLLSQLRQTTRS